MASDTDPLVGPLGQPCKVYVEHAGAERIAPGQEQMIKGVGGIVVEDPNQASVVVVIKRGAETIEQRIRDTCIYRKTSPWTQGVVDGLWVADCIHQSKLLGPPEWGGHLYRPALESVITQDEADAAAFSVFGRPIDEPEHEEDTEEPNSMQLDPAPAAPVPAAPAPAAPVPAAPVPAAAGGSGSNPQNHTSEESSIGVTSATAGDVPVPPSNGGTTQGPRTRSSKNKGSQKPKDSFLEAWIKVEKIVEDPKKKGWFGTFSTNAVLNLIQELCQLGAITDSEPALSWWEEFNKRAEPDYVGSGLRKHTADSWRELYRNRKGMIKKCVNKLIIARPAYGSDSLRGIQDHSTPRTSRYDRRSHSGKRTLYQNFEETDLTILTDTSSDLSDDELQLISVTTEPVAQPRKGGPPPRKAANNQEGRLPQTPQQGEKTGAVALPKRLRIKPTNGAPVLKQLSNRDEEYTAADYDEVADYIGKQIQAMNPPEREVVAVMTQDSVWKAFVTMYLTDRDWKEWRNYYRGRANDINRTTRVRLKRAEPSVSQVAAEIEPLASELYNSPPPNGILKRSLEGSSDERRPKHPRL